MLSFFVKSLPIFLLSYGLIALNTVVCAALDEKFPTLSTDELRRSCGVNQITNENDVSFNCAMRLSHRWVRGRQDEDRSDKVFETVLQAAERLSKSNEHHPTFELYNTLYRRVETSDDELKARWALSCIKSAEKGHPFKEYPLDAAVTMLEKTLMSISDSDDKTIVVGAVVNAAMLYLDHDNLEKTRQMLVRIKPEVMGCSQEAKSIWAKSVYHVGLERFNYQQPLYDARAMLLHQLNQDDDKQLAYDAAVCFISKDFYIDQGINDFKMAANRLHVLMRDADANYKEKCIQQVIKAAEIMMDRDEHCDASKLLSTIDGFFVHLPTSKEDKKLLRDDKLRLNYASAVLNTKPCEGGFADGRRQRALDILKGISSAEAEFKVASYHIDAQAYTGPEPSDLRRRRNENNIRRRAAEPPFRMTEERAQFHESVTTMVELARRNDGNIKKEAVNEVVRAAEIMIDTGIEGDKSSIYMAELLSEIRLEDEKIKLKCADLIYQSTRCSNPPGQDQRQLARETLIRLAKRADDREVRTEAEEILSRYGIR